MRLSEILSEESKWCQGAFYRAGACCIEGAMQKMLGLSPASPSRSDLEAYSEALALGRTIVNGTVLFQFNDEPDRTFDEIQEFCQEFDKRWESANGTQES
jgi:hypothetical protein